MEHISKLASKKIILLSLLYLFGPVFFIVTEPNSLPLPVLVLPFVWLFTVLLVTLQLLLRRKGMAKKRRTIFSLAVSVFVVLLAVFQSIHQLTISDVLLSVGLVVVLGVYLARADFL